MLGDLVWKSEDKAHPMPAVSGEDVPRHILESRDLSQAEPSRGNGIAEPTISAIRRPSGR